MSDYTAVRLRVPLRSRQPLPDTGAVLWQPVDDPGHTPLLVLGHGAGSDLTNPILCAVGRGLALQGIPVLTFNFAYAEAGLKRPDPPARLLAVFQDAIAAATERLGTRRPLVLGGRSMGGRMATLLAAEGRRCDGLLLLSYPLHQAGRPERLRTEHWPLLRAPILFVTGDRDRLCDLGLLAAERAARLAAPSRVHIIAGADHGFAIRKSDPRAMADVFADVVDVSAGWLRQAVGSAPTPAGLRG